MIAFFLISAGCAFLFWLIGNLILWRIPFCKNDGAQTNLPPCSIIIPARNEEANIRILLQSMQASPMIKGEVIVVNDQSTDKTAMVAEQFGVKIISISEKPADWTGKTWACWQGAQAAQYDIMIFIDADTRLVRGGLQRMINTYVRYGGMVTLQPYHTMNKSYEKLSSFFNIMTMAGIGAFTIFGKNMKSSGSFGPCMICNKRDYFDTGGHQAVYKTVLENLSLGKIFIKAGKSVHCFGGKNTINVQMYPFGPGDMVEGWTKGFATGAANTRPVYLIMTIFWITGCFITSTGLCLSPMLNQHAHLFTGGYGFLYILYVAQIYWMLFRLGNFGILSALLFPMHALFFIMIFIRSYISIFITKRITWRGRSIKV